MSIVALYESGTLQGWRDDPFQLMYNAKMALKGDVASKGKDTFLYRPLQKKLLSLGLRWRSKYQKSGTCVGQGSAFSADCCQALADAMGIRPWEGRVSVAGEYAGGRVDIAGRPGRWEGSNGSWTMAFNTKIGQVLLKDLGLHEDSLDEDEALALRWTASPQGVPSDKETLARNRLIKKTVMPTDARHMGRLIENGYAGIFCGTYIPSGQRDANGFSKLKRGGGHCTAAAAVRWETGPSGKFGILYVQSWGDKWGSGNKYPDDQPDWSVWLDEEDVNKMIAQGDCHCFVPYDEVVEQDLTYLML